VGGKSGKKDHRETGRIGKRGSFVIPAALRRRFGLEEGALVIAEERPEGVLIRPALAVPIETYSPERKAEFLLSNAVDRKDYLAARAAVEAMGVDPNKIPHATPPGA
jgi:AbrB family looped-hinge helix DNA binding protein